MKASQSLLRISRQSGPVFNEEGNADGCVHANHNVQMKALIHKEFAPLTMERYEMRTMTRASEMFSA